MYRNVVTCIFVMSCQQAKAEQEEEFISNTLLKKIQALKKEKETLAHHYEREEECLTNDLSRKLTQLRQEKCRLEQTLEQEQECLVNRLMRKIEKLEAETLAKQSNLEQLRREKVYNSSFKLNVRVQNVYMIFTGRVGKYFRTRTRSSSEQAMETNGQARGRETNVAD